MSSANQNVGRDELAAMLGASHASDMVAAAGTTAGDLSKSTGAGAGVAGGGGAGGGPGIGRKHHVLAKDGEDVSKMDRAQAAALVARKFAGGGAAGGSSSAAAGGAAATRHRAAGKRKRKLQHHLLVGDLMEKDGASAMEREEDVADVAELYQKKSRDEDHDGEEEEESFIKRSDAGGARRKKAEAKVLVKRRGDGERERRRRSSSSSSSSSESESSDSSSSSDGSSRRRSRNRHRNRHRRDRGSRSDSSSSSSSEDEADIRRRRARERAKSQRSERDAALPSDHGVNGKEAKRETGRNVVEEPKQQQQQEQKNSRRNRSDGSDDAISMDEKSDNEKQLREKEAQQKQSDKNNRQKGGSRRLSNSDKSSSSGSSSSSSSDSSSSSSDDSSSSSSSDESDHNAILPTTVSKPLFVPKSKRGTVAEIEMQQQKMEEADKRREAEAERRAIRSRALVAEAVSASRTNGNRAGDDDGDEFDTGEAGGEFLAVPDDADPAEEDAPEKALAERDAWEVRELLRILRDVDEALAREKERKELERRRALTDEERLAEDRRTGRYRAPGEARRQKRGGPGDGSSGDGNKGGSYLQRFHHRGAFYMDEDTLQQAGGDDVRHRAAEYSRAATGEDKIDKSALPEVMQVKKFGFAGYSTKYKGLAKEDTTDRKQDFWPIRGAAGGGSSGRGGGRRNNHGGGGGRSRERY